MYYIRFQNLNQRLLESTVGGLTTGEYTGVCEGKILLGAEQSGCDVIVEMLDVIRHSEAHADTRHQWLQTPESHPVIIVAPPPQPLQFIRKEQ
jgi:hypothetical protein